MTASKNKKYSNAYYKRPTMSVLEGAALAKKRNKKQDERKKEIDKAAKKYAVGGGEGLKYGPHKVDIHRRFTESLLGTGSTLRGTREKMIQLMDKAEQKLKERRKKKKKN